MIEDNIKPNINLADYTTFKIGGPAKFFVEAATKEELQAALAWAKAQDLPYFILAGGSNILVSDNGFNGLVIKINNQEIEQNGYELTAAAGARLGDVVAWTTDAGLAGLEWASGVPGSVGGAVRGNAGCYGGETKNSIKEVEFFDIRDNQFKIWPVSRLDFNYRSSLFKHDETKIIWRVVFSLTPGSPKELQDYAINLINLRVAKLPKFPSAGSVFKNLLDETELALTLGVEDQIKGGKLATAVIIENLGLKGKQIGGAKISDEHANFIVNYSKASAQDVKTLVELIKQEAKAKFNLELEEEIQYLGLF